MATLSHRAFARLTGLSHQAIGRAVREGRLIVEADGLDPEHPANAAYISAHHTGSTNGTEAQIAALHAKARWQAERLQRVVDGHVEKVSIAEGVKATLLLLQVAAPLIPNRYGRVVAARLEISEDAARALLQDVADLLLREIEGLPDQGHAAAMRLSA